MLNDIRRRMIRLALAAAVTFLLLGQPLVALPNAVLPAYADECTISSGGGCGG